MISLEDISKNLEEVFLDALADNLPEKMKFFQEAAKMVIKQLKEIKTEPEKIDFIAGVLHGMYLSKEIFEKSLKTLGKY